MSMSTARSVVTLTCPGARGSGFVVYFSPQACLITTCQHVVGANQDVQVIFPGETKAHKARVRHTNNELDIGLVRYVPDEKSPPRVPLRFADPNTTPLNRGDVQMMGYHKVPYGRLLSPGVFDGQICGEPADGYIRCNYTSEPGTSGGPVLKGDTVVGVNCRYSGAIRFAASVANIRTAFGEWLNLADNNLGFDEMLPMFAAAAE